MIYLLLMAYGTIIIVPLLQVAGLIYLSDIFAISATTGLLIIGGKEPRANRLRLGCALIAAGFILGSSAMTINYGFSFRALSISLQYFIYLAMAYGTYSYLRDRPQEYQRFVVGVSWLFAITAVIGVMQFIAFQISPDLAKGTYYQYLELAGRPTGWYERKYFKGSETTGFLRIIGTWDVPTTFGGVLTVGLVFLAVSRVKKHYKYAIGAITILAILATSTRHAWFLGFAALLFLTKSRVSSTIARAPVAALSVLVIIVVVNSAVEGEAGGSGLTRQLESRADRTLEQGAEDTWLQARYVVGTRRFFRFLKARPSTVVTGFGSHSEMAHDENWSYVGDEAHLASLKYGFVSNGWLLGIRNWGLMFPIGLILILWFPFRRGGIKLRALSVILAMLLLSDNYSVQVARAFCLVLGAATVLNLSVDLENED